MRLALEIVVAVSAPATVLIAIAFAVVKETERDLS